MNFKKILAAILVTASITTMLASCGAQQTNDDTSTESQSEESSTTIPPINNNNDEEIVIPPEELKNLGDSLENAGINKGKFEGDTTTTDFAITCISGTENAYSYDDSKKTLTFSALSADSAYSISGKLKGNIIIDVGESYALTLELSGLALRSSNATPIAINSGKSICISAKNGTTNYVYDERAAIEVSKDKSNNASIFSVSDITLCGKGELFVQSLNNNGIQSDADINVKELSLIVECNDKAINGKNNVTLENCSTLLVAKSGDAIKTEASHITESSAKQNGNVSIFGGTHNIFASNDGIEAAYDVIVDNGSYVDETTKENKTVATILNVYTDKYSSYTSTSAHDKPEVEARALYVCYTEDTCKYSIKLFNADQTKSEWVNPTFHESLKSGRKTYYTYKFYVKPEYTKMQAFIYSNDQTQQNEETYKAKSDITDIKSDSDTYRYSGGNRKAWEWKTYSSLTQQGGSNANANPNAVSYSAKGIKGANAVAIKAGSIKINAVDNAISTGNPITLDNGKAPIGDISVNGGNIMINTKCNGLNSYGALTINGGSIKIFEAFDGFNANTIKVTDGDISIKSTNDGLSASAKSGAGITVDGGKIYVYPGSYGFKSSSTTSYGAMSFNGGDMVIIAPEAKKSAIYSDGGYTYTDGRILAILNIEGNRTTTTNYYSFAHVGKIQELNLTENIYTTVDIDGEIIVAAKSPKAFSATAIYIGDKTVNISSSEQINETINSDNIYWID